MKFSDKRLLNKKITFVVSIICCLSIIMTAIPTGSALAGTVSRYTKDAVETSVQVCRDMWNKESTTVILASIASETEILLAAPLAGQEKAPFLLTDPSVLDERVAEVLTELKPQKIYYIGGLSEKLINEVKKLEPEADLQSLQEETLRETSEAINQKLNNVNGTDRKSVV
jgi:putative cell wall-binding protein